MSAFSEWVDEHLEESCEGMSDNVGVEIGRHGVGASIVGAEASPVKESSVTADQSNTNAAWWLLKQGGCSYCEEYGSLSDHHYYIELLYRLQSGPEGFDNSRNYDRYEYQYLVEWPKHVVVHGVSDAEVAECLRREAEQESHLQDDFFDEDAVWNEAERDAGLTPLEDEDGY